MSSSKKIYKELLNILFTEQQILFVFLAYSIFISLIYLAVPLGAQIIVNIISTGVLIQPLVIISIGVLFGLIFLGVLRILQLYITEILQRKIFAKISWQTASRLLKVAQKHLSEVYAPELVNRFFDTVTIQKSLTLILLEVPSAILQILVGLIIMGIYHPILIVFDIFLIAVIFLIVILGYRGLETSLAESSSKYKVAYWLEEIARCNVGFKMNAKEDFLLNHLDEKILNYLSDRKQHFKVILRQFSGSYLFEAFASAGVLSIGAWLVINGKMTLGQLVASEIIILMILSSIDKIVQKIETWYDLLTAIDKVSYISKLGVEKKDGILLEPSEIGSEIKIIDVDFSYNDSVKVFNKLNMELSSGARASLVGVSGSGKTSLAYILSGLYEINSGHIFIDGRDIRSIDLDSLRTRFALVSDFNEIFSGTVEENILLGRNALEKDSLDKVIDLLELERDLRKYPKGLNTKLLSEGRNISLGQRQRILIARSIIGNPQLLILDEAFGGMDEMTKLKIINKIFDLKNPWTILNITHDAEVVARTKEIFLLEDGAIKEKGLIDDLSNDTKSSFSQLFPELAKFKIREAN